MARESSKRTNSSTILFNLSIHLCYLFSFLLPPYPPKPTPTPSNRRTPRTPTLRPRNIPILAKRIHPPRRLTQILTARIRLAATRLRRRVVTIYTNGLHRKPGTLLTRTIRRRNIPILTELILRPERLTYIPTARIRRAGTALRDRAKSKHTVGVHRTRVTSTVRACDIGGAAEGRGL